MSIADFVMYMILNFDLGKPASANYDEALAPLVDAYLSHFRGLTIDSTDPLIITTYDDRYYLDAEWMPTTWWPGYGFGDGAWHNMAVGVTADAKGELAFSTDKAGAKGIEWMSLIAGPSLEILKGDLDALSASGGIVYTPTLSLYLTPEEIATRYANLTDWYKLQGHFWVGTGPFWLDEAFPVEKTLSLRRFEDYPDPANRWAGFGTPPIPVIEVTGPASVKVGAADAVFDVAVTFAGEPYASKDISGAKYLVFDATGALAGQGELTLAEEGKYSVTLPADITSKLTAGSSKLEVVITSNLVAVPGIFDYEFVVTQ
jgi:peptide/nickel transport system substrate-binding protein